MRVENKVVLSYVVPEAGKCRHVTLLDFYFSKLHVPSETLEKHNSTFVHCKKKPVDPVLHGLHQCKLASIL